MQTSQCIEKEVDNVLASFPALKKQERTDQMVLGGTLPIVSQDGQTIDSYDIEIHLTKSYPDNFPLVYEVGDKIPRNVDWHVYEQGGNLCLCLPIEEKLACKSGISLSDFIEQYVIPYLFGQTFRREKGYFYRERSHGWSGILEYFYELFSLKDLDLVRVLLLIVLNNEEPNPHSKCVCGNNKKFKKCHRMIARKLKSDAKDIQVRNIIISTLYQLEQQTKLK